MTSSHLGTPTTSTPTAPRARLGFVALAIVVVAWWAVRVVDGGAPRQALDAYLYALPTYAATWERIRGGVLPLWNPYQLCGIPWIATLQGGTFYPPNVLYAVLPLHVAFAVLGVLHLVLAALGTAAFVRRLGLGLAAAWLAAVAFAMRGDVPSALGQANTLGTLAWLPVGAVALVDLVRAPGRRPTALLAAATAASFLAGYPQTTVYTIYVWGSLFLALLVHERPPISGIALRAAAFAGALAVGAAVAAVQLAPALELMRVGTRSAALTERTMFPWGNAMAPALMRLWASLSGTQFAFGIVALALVPAALLSPRRRVLAVWAIALAVVTAAWANGGPLFDLYLALPALGLFRLPVRLLFVTDFAVAIAAALGLSAVVGDADGAPARGWARAGAVALMVVGLVTVFVLVRRGWTFGPADRVVLFATIAAAAIVLLVLVPASRRAVIGAAIAAAVTVEIAANPWGGARLPYSAADVALYETIGPDLDAVARLAGHDRVWRAHVGIQVEHAHKLSTWHRLRTTTDYEPTNLKRQADFFTYFADGAITPTRFPYVFMGDADPFTTTERATAAATRRRLLDVAAVRFVVLPKDAPRYPTFAAFIARARLVPATRTAQLAVLRNPTALPRAFVTYRARTAPAEAEALLTAMSADAFDPMVESFVEGPPPFEAAPDAPPRGHAATFVRDDETEVELDVRLERPGLVVLSDSFYPDWHATVDGVPAPIVATNHLFRGVPAPAGAHRVRFVYAPASVRVGAALSVLGVLVLGWLALGGRARRRRRPSDAE